MSELKTGKAPTKEERLNLGIKEVYFLPANLVHTIEADPEAICIGIRSIDTRHVPYKEGMLATRYLCEGIPFEVTDPQEQRDFKHKPVDRFLPGDRVYIKKQLMHGAAQTLREFGPQAKRLYVNCSMGETRSYALACAVAFYLGFEPQPVEGHRRDENAYTNGDLQGAFDMMMYRYFKDK